jgi:hypothetical protein
MTKPALYTIAALLLISGSVLWYKKGGSTTIETFKNYINNLGK